MAQQPSIIVSSLDLQRLERLLEKDAYKHLPGVDDLRAELDRARIAIAGEVVERGADHAGISLLLMLHCNIDYPSPGEPGAARARRTTLQTRSTGEAATVNWKTT